jgi:Zn-dependent peptidase ImmA (M78 family)/transcriptional regulator with XRE-family HTH domain
MRSGIPGFSGARLAEARLARGITSRKALADMLQRAPSTVIRWEEGETAPEAIALSDLARALSVPEDFFLSERTPGGSMSFFRSFASALKADRLAQQARLLWLGDVTAVADHYAYLPKPDFPDLLFDRGFRSLRDEAIEGVAQSARDHFGLGMKPIDNMVAFLEQIGVIVGSEPIETDRLDAVSRWGADGRPYVLLADDKQSFARRQFDCAHELAHLMLHRCLSKGEFEENFKLIESQADRFASAFLLPAGQFPLEVERCTLWELERLKVRWRVSIKAQIVRLSRLDIINADTATRFYKIYSAKGYAKAEPYDAAWPLQRPTLLADVFRAIIDDGQLSKAELRHDLPLLPHDVESLASLPEGWLTRETARVIALRPTGVRDQSESKPSSAAVLQ